MFCGTSASRDESGQRARAECAHYRVILFLDSNELVAHLLLTDVLSCDEVLQLAELVAVHGADRRVVVARVAVDVRVSLECVHRVRHARTAILGSAQQRPHLLQLPENTA